MSFKTIERTSLTLSIFTLLGLGEVASTYANEIKPVTAQACIGLESDADRLACYDQVFAPTAIQSDSSLEVARHEPNKLNAENGQNSVKMFSFEADQINSSPSLFDQRWELASNSKLGTWNIRAYQPVYLLPIFWTSDKNEFPQSPNPQNTVDQDQNLKSTESKFQISLKTKAVENIFGNNGDLWLGYTQSSRWQVYNSKESRPFRETNYEPEASLMFRTQYNFLGLNGRLLGLTLNHQSNGRSDPLSRSWNRVILNLGFEKNNFAIMLRPWYRIEEDFNDDNNPDIKNYIGRGDLTAFYRWNDNDFSLMLRHSLKGGEDSHGAMQFDWTFPINGKLRGHLQLFDGYGESLIDYNHRATYIGLGVSLLNWF